MTAFYFAGYLWETGVLFILCAIPIGLALWSALRNLTGEDHE